MKEGLGIRDWGLEERKAEGGGRRTGRHPLFSRSRALHGNAVCPPAFRFPPSALRLPPSAFTLIELLVTISIIGIMAGLVFGALMAARQSGREAATKATIAKLNAILMRRYESYMTRRIPLDLSTNITTGARLTPFQVAQDRLYAIRDLMRMEMPDRIQDVPTPVGATKLVGDSPITLPNSQKTLAVPALGSVYYNRLAANPPPNTGVQNGAAELLYMIVSMGSPEAMEQFNASEIGDTNGNGYPEFLDGWGRPIFFLRWAPGFSPYSDVQAADPVNNHDPFDTRRTENAYKLIPLIYSGGPNGNLGLANQENYHFGDTSNPGTMFSGNSGTVNAFLTIGVPSDNSGKGTRTDFQDNITNHHIEAR